MDAILDLGSLTTITNAPISTARCADMTYIQTQIGRMTVAGLPDAVIGGGRHAPGLELDSIGDLRPGRPECRSPATTALELSFLRRERLTQSGRHQGTFALANSVAHASKLSTEEHL